MNLDHEDALRILVAMLAARPDGFTDGNRPPMWVFGYQEFLRSFVGPIASIQEAIRVSTIERSFGEFGSHSLTPRGKCAAEEFFALV
jgi:hypothetical protein